jgi:hypothetical protein
MRGYYISKRKHLDITNSTYDGVKASDASKPQKRIPPFLKTPERDIHIYFFFDPILPPWTKK